MARMRYLPLVALLVAGCWPAPTGTGASGSAQRTTQRPIPALTTASEPPKEPSPAPTASPAPAAQPTSGTRARLSGVIRLPDALRAAGYRTLAVEQKPLANVVVQLLDAAGEAVEDAEGQPLTATTGADGRYAFTAALPARPMILAVQLPGGRGILRAVVPRGAAEADADWISTLTTTYLLDRYINGRGETFEKLPALLERELRKKAEAAVESAGIEAPASLDADNVLGAIERLKKQNLAFAAQLQRVERLLLAASAATPAPSGTPAPWKLLELHHDLIRRMAMAPDGSLVLDAGGLKRLTSDGLLTELLLKRDGAVVLSNTLGTIRGFQFDAQGRLLMLCGGVSNYSLVIREPDGELTTLLGGDAWPAGSGTAYAAVWGPDGAVHLLAGGGYWVIAPGGGLTAQEGFVPPPSHLTAVPARYGFDAAGRFYLNYATWIQRFDPADMSWTTLSVAGEFGVEDTAVDSTGHMYQIYPSKHMERLAPDDSSTMILDGQDPVSGMQAVVSGSDGSVYMSGRHGRIYQLHGNRKKLILGIPLLAGIALDQLERSMPRGIAVAPDGTMYVSEDYHEVIYRVGTDGRIAIHAGVGATTKELGHGDGGPATRALLRSPSTLGLDAAGRLYVAEDLQLRMIDQQGVITTVHQTQTANPISDFAVTKDGVIYVSTREDDVPKVLRFARAGAAPEVIHSEPEDTDRSTSELFMLSLDPNDQLYMARRRQLRRWEAESGATLLMSHDDFQRKNNTFNAIAVDGQGRVYVSDQSAFNGSTVLKPPTIVRIDSTMGGRKVIAGAGGTHFTQEGEVGKLADMTLSPQGDLLFCNAQGSQDKVRRIPASEL